MFSIISTLLKPKVANPILAGGGLQMIGIAGRTYECDPGDVAPWLGLAEPPHDAVVQIASVSWCCVSDASDCWPCDSVLVPITPTQVRLYLIQGAGMRNDLIAMQATLLYRHHAHIVRDPERMVVFSTQEDKIDDGPWEIDLIWVNRIASSKLSPTPSAASD